MGAVLAMWLSGLLGLALLGVFLLVGCGKTPYASSSAEYLPLEGPLANPERGFFADSYYPMEAVLDPWAKQEEARAHGLEVRLIRRTYYLHSFAGGDALPQDFLATLARDLARAQEAGLKLILRFAYRPEENQSGGPVYCDPPKERILVHLAQLGPVLRERLGVVAYLEAGLIGPWGEWHSASPETALMDPLPGYEEGVQPPCGSRNYDRKLPNRRTLEVVEALLKQVPGRMVALRYPMAKAKLMELQAGGGEGTYPAPPSFTPLSPGEAHGEGLKARLGAHNDCFLASADDFGTFPPGPQAEREREFWSQDNRFLVMGGETCTPTPHVPPGQDPAAYVYGEFRRFRFSTLNLNYHPGFLEWMRRTPFGGGTLLEALDRDLGYRLHLRRAEVSQVGSRLELGLELENMGFGGVYNPKGLRLVWLREADGWETLQTLGENFFGPPPGEALRYTFTLAPPAQQGDYALLLEVYDPLLPHDPRYHLHLASQMPYREGRHYLGLRLRVR